MNVFETVRNNVKAIDVAIMAGFRPKPKQNDMLPIS